MAKPEETTKVGYEVCKRMCHETRFENVTRSTPFKPDNSVKMISASKYYGRFDSFSSEAACLSRSRNNATNILSCLNRPCSHVLGQMRKFFFLVRRGDQGIYEPAWIRSTDIPPIPSQASLFFLLSPPHVCFRDRLLSFFRFQCVCVRRHGFASRAQVITNTPREMRVHAGCGIQQSRNRLVVSKVYISLRAWDQATPLLSREGELEEGGEQYLCLEKFVYTVDFYLEKVFNMAEINHLILRYRMQHLVFTSQLPILSDDINSLCINVWQLCLDSSEAYTDGTKRY